MVSAEAHQGRLTGGASGSASAPAGLRGSLVAFAVYAVAIPLLIELGVTGGGARGEDAAAVLLVLTVYSGIRIAWELHVGAYRWFVLAFHSFAYVFLGVAPLAQIGTGTLLWAVNPAPDVLLEAAVVSLGGVLLFDLGLWFGLSLAGPRSRPRRARVQFGERGEAAATTVEDDYVAAGEYRVGAALVLLLTLTGVSLLVLGLRGGFSAVLSSRDEMQAALCSAGVSTDLAQCGIVTALVRVPPVILVIVALGIGASERQRLRPFAVAVGTMSLLLTANPISTARFWFGAVAIGVFGLFVARSIRSSVLLWLALPALLILVFPATDFARRQGWTPEIALDTGALVFKQDFDAFQQLANGITYVDVYGERGGKQLASSLLFFVPRSIWPEKAPPTGTLVTASLGVSDNTNVSAPLWEEAYVDFGIGGVAVVFVAFGVAVAITEAALRQPAYRRHELAVAVAPFFAGYSIFLMRGSLLPAIGPLAVATLLVWLVSRFRHVARASVPEDLSARPADDWLLPRRPGTSSRRPTEC